MRTISFLIIAAFAATAGHAAPAADGNAVSISADVRGIQPTNQGDMSRLNRRVSKLARAVCESPGTRPLRARAAYDECRTAALRDAHRQVEAAMAGRRDLGNARLAAK